MIKPLLWRYERTIPDEPMTCDMKYDPEEMLMVEDDRAEDQQPPYCVGHADNAQVRRETTDDG